MEPKLLIIEEIDSVAVEAGRGEPLSRCNSLLTGKKTGNFENSRANSGRDLWGNCSKTNGLSANFSETDQGI
jgi:hypothetical protein